MTNLDPRVKPSIRLPLRAEELMTGGPSSDLDAQAAMNEAIVEELDRIHAALALSRIS